MSEDLGLDFCNDIDYDKRVSTLAKRLNITIAEAVALLLCIPDSLEDVQKNTLKFSRIKALLEYLQNEDE